jgi:hypothetical protein
MLQRLTIVCAVLLAACHRAPTAAPHSAAPDFCTALTSNNMRDAQAAIYAALPKPRAADALEAFLHAQACVTAVEVSPDVVDTAPAIREITVKAKTNSRDLNYHVELTLGGDYAVAIGATSALESGQ